MSKNINESVCQLCNGSGWVASKWSKGLDSRCNECEGTGRADNKSIPHLVIPRTGSSSDRWCVHYAGFSGPSLVRKTHCNAGVEYASVQKTVEFTYSYGKEKTRYKSTVAHPCFRGENELTDGCSKCRFRTPEEMAAEREMLLAHFRKTDTARAAIIDHIKDAVGVSGKIACPVCHTGTLSFTRAALNGHVHARCSTDDCVAWME